jgi:hypothetical protein
LQQLVHSNAPAMATILENSGFEWNMLAPQWFLQVRMRAHLDAELPQNHYPHTTIKFPYNSNRDATEKRGDFLYHCVLILSYLSNEKSTMVRSFVVVVFFMY